MTGKLLKIKYLAYSATIKYDFFKNILLAIW